MFDSHPPFQIDGNFGGAAAILEMIVQSWGGEIRLLPALPRAWSGGELRGVRVRGGIELDIRWASGRVTALTLRGTPHAPIVLRHGARSFAITLDEVGRTSIASKTLAENL
jgi:alpha-L-fucosidase 2